MDIRIAEINTKVKKANKDFYDIVSNSYEQIDGKRDATAEAWIAAKLHKIRRNFDEQPHALLDVGCGSGFVMRNAMPSFQKVVGIDLSHKILVPLQKQGYMVVCADTDYLPFKEKSFSVVSCFAVLHHLYAHEGLLQESFRILKRDGIFYSDHDLDKAFSKKFSVLFKFYRFLFNEEKKYRKKEKMISTELYHYTEIHNTGVLTKNIIAAAKSSGFAVVELSYHWLGLFPIVTRILRKYKTRFSKGNAPLVSIIAKKVNNDRPPTKSSHHF